MQFYDVKAGLRGVTPNLMCGKGSIHACVMSGNHTRVTPPSDDKTTLIKPRTEENPMPMSAVHVLHVRARDITSRPPWTFCPFRIANVMRHIAAIRIALFGTLSIFYHALVRKLSRNHELLSTLKRERISQAFQKCQFLSDWSTGSFHPVYRVQLCAVRNLKRLSFYVRAIVQLCAIVRSFPENIVQYRAIYHDKLGSPATHILVRRNAEYRGKYRGITRQTAGVVDYPKSIAIAPRKDRYSRDMVSELTEEPMSTNHDFLKSRKRGGQALSGSVGSIHLSTVKSPHIAPFSEFRSIAEQLPGGP